MDSSQAVLTLLGKLSQYEKERIEVSILKLSIDFDRLLEEAEAATRPPASEGEIG